MFPPLETADEDGLIAVGGDLAPQTLATAYRSGVFPWPVEGLPTLWFAPPERCILRFDEFHISKRLRRELEKRNFEYSIDRDFTSVIKACAAPRSYESGTWISPEIQRAYRNLHRRKIAHSIEVWENGTLVGGLYGVSWGAYFCGESMFHNASGASKAALVFLVEHLKSRGATWLDVQMPTPLFESFGARLVPRENFMTQLQSTISQPISLFETEISETKNSLHNVFVAHNFDAETP